MRATLDKTNPRIHGRGRFAALILSLTISAGAYAVCMDADGDGYGNPASGDCTHPQLDCNDSNPLVNPGAAEKCDLVDNDCDGTNNEGFDVGAQCGVFDPPGCTAMDPGGCCITQGTKVCTMDGLTTVCDAGDPEPHESEGPGGSANCFDLKDNDCDGLTDHQDPSCQTAELCNYFDDDNDGMTDEGFTGLGDACTEGTGVCLRNGITVCRGDGMGTQCSATAGPAATEGPGGSASCNDNKDNDCDGNTDLNDADCQGPETCDNADNNGNGQIDETFSDKGTACSNGLGQCLSNGTRVCAPNGMSTVCNAVAGLPSPEGPSGPTCNDGIDNDCDGFTDNNDSNCNSAALMARCALLPIAGLDRNKDAHSNTCTSWHTIDFDIMGAGPNADVVVELLAINADGETLQAIPVQNGDVVELAALPLDDDCIVTQTNAAHRIYAPVAMLHVSVHDGNNTAHAYCTNIPYLDVIEPSGQVISASEGDVLPVLAAIPQIDLATLFVKVDGVDLLSAIGIDPGMDFPGGPFSGNVMIDGRMVHVSDLRVKQSPLGTLDSNILSMNLEGLGGGCHIVVVDASPHPTALPLNWSAGCYADDVRDKGESSGLEIRITSPTPGQVTHTVPTPVMGEIRSGRPIGTLAINGMHISTAGQMFVPGDGENSCDEYRFAINTAVQQTDLMLDISTGNAPLGTFDRGSNRLVIDVLDDIASRTFATQLFATGNVGSQVIDMPNAFVVGIEASAIQDLFNERSAAVGQQFVDAVRAKLQEAAANPKYITVEFDCCCDVNAAVRPVSPFVSADPSQLTTTVTFLQDKFKVRINFPTFTTYMAMDGKCREACTDCCGCAIKSDIHTDITLTTTGMYLEFEVTEGQILGTAQPSDPVFEKGMTTSTTNDRGSGTGGILCDVCSALSTIAGFLLDILTLGFLPNSDNPFYDFLIPSFETSATDDAVQEAIGSSQPDPVELGEIKIDEETVAEFQQTLMGELDIVEISPLGLKAALKATFTTNQLDPSIPPVPGAVLTPANAPGFPQEVMNADEVYVALSDDVMNQFFASMAASGLLKANCQNTGKVLGDTLMLPADCETVMGMSANETAAQQGRCHGFKGADCDTIPLTTGMGLGLIELATCKAVKNLNLRENTPLLVCVQQEMPPRLLIDDDTNTSPVETTIRLNDLSVAIVADRDGGGLQGDLLALRNCFQAGASTVNDCNLFAVCLDLNIMNQMQFQTCQDGKPGIVTTPTSIATTIRQLGVVCGAAAATNDDVLTDVAGGDPQVMEMLNDLEDFSPPLCANGLTLGGFVSFVAPKLISINVPGGDPQFADYLGITGGIDP